MSYYSQNDEERYIVERFKDHSGPGTFLDIGAFDGKTFSNTLRLAEMGWAGVCVEPSPVPFASLMAVHRERPQVHLVHAAVCPSDQAVFRPFLDCGGDAVSTTVEAHARKWMAGSTLKYQPFWTLMLPLRGLFQEFGTRFDFLNLDVESANLELFLAMPWADLLRLKMVCVEHDGHFRQMESALLPFGFKKVAQNPENILLVR